MAPGLTGNFYSQSSIAGYKANGPFSLPGTHLARPVHFSQPKLYRAVQFCLRKLYQVVQFSPGTIFA